jgi:hypothetical protein
VEGAHVTNEIRCKRIIEGRTYNTETATLLGGYESDDSPDEESLFKTRHGAYFLHVFRETGPDEWIHPLSPEAAQKWMEKNCSAEKTEAEFGEMPEAGDPEARFTLRIPETLRKRIAMLAETREQSLNAWIQRCLEHCASEMEKAL